MTRTFAEVNHKRHQCIYSILRTGVQELGGVLIGVFEHDDFDGFSTCRRFGKVIGKSD